MKIVLTNPVEDMLAGNDIAGWLAAQFNGLDNEARTKKSRFILPNWRQDDDRQYDMRAHQGPIN
ncbi:hypothetical protein [Mesorhizobium sp. L-2-11]|uniref:hypothetical protein n=1 Tax=Mesorhizobium sp. L-2-11 TaxID=2744521 RepID=UPI0018EB5D86|nr:hypothetical protein [Mesorhizobium sp. L-2-11]BCH19738.1 hypothetical protein MesoLjLa_65890 [Mesorhizobium sp. L-2-11]